MIIDQGLGASSLNTQRINVDKNNPEFLAEMPVLAIADDAAAANFETHLLVADYADAYTDDAAAAYYITYVADYDAGDAAAAPSPKSPLPRADYGDAAAASPSKL